MSIIEALRTSETLSHDFDELFEAQEKMAINYIVTCERNGGDVETNADAAVALVDAVTALSLAQAEIAGQDSDDDNEVPMVEKGSITLYDANWMAVREAFVRGFMSAYKAPGMTRDYAEDNFYPDTVVMAVCERCSLTKQFAKRLGYALGYTDGVDTKARHDYWKAQQRATN